MRDRVAASLRQAAERPLAPNCRRNRPRAETRAHSRMKAWTAGGRSARDGRGAVRGSDHRPAPRSRATIHTPMTVFVPVGTTAGPTKPMARRFVCRRNMPRCAGRHVRRHRRCRALGDARPARRVPGGARRVPGEVKSAMGRGMTALPQHRIDGRRRPSSSCPAMRRTWPGARRWRWRLGRGREGQALRPVRLSRARRGCRQFRPLHAGRLARRCGGDDRRHRRARSCWSGRRWVAGSCCWRRWRGRTGLSGWSGSRPRPISPTGGSTLRKSALLHDRRDVERGVALWPRPDADDRGVLAQRGRNCCCCGDPIAFDGPVRPAAGSGRSRRAVADRADLGRAAAFSGRAGDADQGRRPPPVARGRPRVLIRAVEDVIARC